MSPFPIAVAGVLAIAAAWPAQAFQADRSAVEAAEEAATQAERAAAAAAQAMQAASEAARAARAAAQAARAAYEGRPFAVGPQAPPEAPRPPLPPTPTAQAELDENMPVRRADATPATISAAERTAFARALEGSVANGPAESALRASFAPDFQFSAAEKDKTGSVSVAFDISNTGPLGYLSAEALTLSASAKLGDSGEIDFGGLKGFTSGTTLELGYSNFWSKVKLDGTEKSQVTAARMNCEAQLGKVAGCDPYKYDKGGVTAFVGKWHPEGVDPLLSAVMPNDVKYWGLKASANQSTFKNLDRATFKESKDERLGLAGTVYGGVLTRQGDAAFGGSFTLKRSYKAGDTVELCQAVASTTLIQCITSQDGPPKRKIQAIAAIEGRRALAVGDTGVTLAVAPELSADLNNDAYSLVVPIYFAGDGSGSLRAGVRGVYTNQKDSKTGGRDEDFAIGLFFGAPFSIFPH